MNKPYGDKRNLMLHSRHLSHRHTPSSFSKLIQRQQSAYKASTMKLTDGSFASTYSAGLLPRRQSGVTLMTQSNWNKPKVYEAWKDDHSTKEETQIMKVSTRNIKTSMYHRRSVDNFVGTRNKFQRIQKEEEESFRKLCIAFGIISDF